LRQPSEPCAMQPCNAARLFSKTSRNQKLVVRLVYPGSAHWVPISGSHVLFDWTAGRADERKATPWGSVS
jgi:hypothetical protein